MGQVPSSPTETGRRVSPPSLWRWSPETSDSDSESIDSDYAFSDGGDFDFTANLPYDCLAHVFQFLGAGDRKRCSLVCKRWLFVDGQNRHRLSLEARDEILPFLPSIFVRFDSVTKLSLRCDRNSLSIGDEALVIVSLRCPNLARLKLRGCREITDLGLESFARNCIGLKKLSCSSCNFGTRGLNAMLKHCELLEELSLKRIRGIHESSEPILPYSSSSLRSICLKELVNGQVFESLVATRTLKKLRIIHCLGSWDEALQMNIDVGGDSSLVEVHLERLQVSDSGLSAISRCRKLEIFHIVRTPDCSDLGLARVVKKCKLIRQLHVDGWRFKRIGDEGLMAVAKYCIDLRELVLVGVDATHKSLSAIASSCVKLERLALCGSAAIGDTEIACIAEKCAALRKFCIKGCLVSDVGVKAIGLGCPSLVKLKVRKCRLVTCEAKEWMREKRKTLVVSLDDDDETKDAIIANENDQGNVEIVVEEVPPPPQVADGGDGVEDGGVGGDAEDGGGGGGGGGGRLAMFRAKLELLAGKNFLHFRRWSQSEATSSS
ncbi:unnamed protein product [Cochlearia groenlandica]